MSWWIRLTQGHLILWWVISVLIPAAGFPGAAESPSPAPPQNLVFQSLDLRFQTLDLRFQTLALTSRAEDVKGAAQALAVKETTTEVKIELAGDVLFDFDKADIRVAAEPALQRVVSEKRAASVKSWLVQKGGVDGKRIKTKGWGKANPVAPNTNPDGSDNPEGRQKNRRVEITVKK